MGQGSVHDEIRVIRRDMEALRHRLLSEELLPSAFRIPPLDETLVLHLNITGYEDREMRIEFLHQGGGAALPFLLDGNNMPIKLDKCTATASGLTISHISQVKSSELPQSLRKYIQSRVAKRYVANITHENDHELRIKIPKRKSVLVGVYDFNCIEVSRPAARKSKFFTSFSQVWDFLRPHLG